MHLTWMEIKDIPPFTEWVDLEFDDRVNLFIGPNASGKSTLLREIDVALNDRRESIQWSLGYYRATRMRTTSVAGPGGRLRSIEGDEFNYIHTSEDWPGNSVFPSPDEPKKAPPVVYIGPVRPGLPSLSDESSTPVDVTLDEALSRPFSGANFKVVHQKMTELAEAMFRREEEDELALDDRRAYHFVRVVEAVESCIKAICREVIEDGPLRNYVTNLNTVQLDMQPLADVGDITIHRSMGINTSDEPNFTNVLPEYRPTYAEEFGKAPLYAGFLSSGTQTTFLWIFWLAYKMLHHYDFDPGWNEGPALLLIDEVENHLHPTWQRRVIPALLEHFPELQIFATTHSPFVVAGLRKGQVHLLDKDENGLVTATTNEHDIIGWTTDEILRALMGVAEPTDQLTVMRARRLRELRGKESLTEDESGELESLRKQVSEDFLSSSSPIDRQRERYADLMLQYIQSRQSDHSQDGC